MRIWGGLSMQFVKAPDLHKQIRHIAKTIGMPHIIASRIVCVRSYGSKSRARARIWSFPKIWQLALATQSHYVIEAVCPVFDRMTADDQTRVLIHELMHIPKNFSGALVPHKGRYTRINSRSVETLFKEYRRNL